MNTSLIGICVADIAIHDPRYCVRQCLHSGSDGAGSLPGNRASDRIDPLAHDSTHRLRARYRMGTYADKQEDRQRPYSRRSSHSVSSQNIIDDSRIVVSGMTIDLVRNKYNGQS